MSFTLIPKTVYLESNAHKPIKSVFDFGEEKVVKIAGPRRLLIYDLKRGGVELSGDVGEVYMTHNLRIFHAVNNDHSLRRFRIVAIEITYTLTSHPLVLESYLMVKIYIHLMIYFLECNIKLPYQSA